MAKAARATWRAGMLTLAGGAFLVLAATIATAATWASAEDAFVQKINAERQANGLAPVSVDVQLTRVARDWSARMAAENHLYHNPGLATAVAGDWQRLGENVGTSTKTGATIDELVDRLHIAFMDSPGHRANVLGDFNYAGVGVSMVMADKMWVTVNFMKAPAVDNGGGQVGEAARVSANVFPDAGTAGGGTAQYVVVGRAEVFADALGGSALAGQHAPVLFTPGPRAIDPEPVLHPRTRAEIDRVLGRRGTVYLLGGTSAVSPRVERELADDGYSVRRLAGPSRVETSVRIAREVVARRGNTGEVIIARADHWADAVTGGAYAAHTGSPVVLTPSSDLHPAAGDFLASHKPERRWALGGAAVLSDRVLARAGAVRVAGGDRTATAVAVAEQLWGRTTAQPGDLFVSTPGFTPSGWAYALAYAPWSATYRGPQLLVSDEVPHSVRDYLRRLGYGGTVSGAVDAASVVPAPVVNELRELVGG
jgi:hypothetical protein